jgi:hypothetical protein
VKHDVEIDKWVHFEYFRKLRTLNVAWRNMINHIVEWIALEKANTKICKEENKGWDLMNTNIAFYLSNLEILFAPSA